MKNSFMAKFMMSFLTLTVFAFFSFHSEASGSGAVIQLGSDSNPPIFSGDLIAPGSTLVKNFFISNVTDSDCNISGISFDFYPGSQGDSTAQNELLNNLYISITDTDTGKVLFDKTAAFLIQNDESCDIGIPKGQTANFTAAALLDSTATNAVQGMNVDFDIHIQSAAVAGGTFSNPKTGGRDITITLVSLYLATFMFIAIWMVRRRHTQ